MPNPDTRPPLKIFKALTRQFNEDMPGRLRSKGALYACESLRSWLIVPLPQADQTDKNALADWGATLAARVPHPWGVAISQVVMDGQFGMRVTMAAGWEVTALRESAARVFAAATAVDRSRKN